MSRHEIKSEVAGSVWKVERAVGDELQAGDVVMILESMKMEIPVETPTAGRLAELLVAPTDSVEEDQVLCIVES